MNVILYICFNFGTGISYVLVKTWIDYLLKNLIDFAIRIMFAVSYMYYVLTSANDCRSLISTSIGI